MKSPTVWNTSRYNVYILWLFCGGWWTGGLVEVGTGLFRMEWRPARWSVCLPLLIFPCTVKSRSSLLALAHPAGPGKRAVKWLCVCVCVWNVGHFAYKTFRLLDTSPTTWTLRLLDSSPTRHFAYWTLRLLRGQFTHSMWTQDNGGRGLGPHLTQTRLGSGLPPYCMPSFIVIRPTVWPQYTNVTDRTDRQRTDSIGWTVLQTVAQKARPPNLC